MLRRILLHCYDVLLRLYPRRFREEFGEELQSTFAEAMAEAAGRGGWALAAVCWRELRDWPIALLNEHWTYLKHKRRRATLLVTRPLPVSS